MERRDWAYAADGARIPISVVYRQGIEMPAPTLLYGYGAYEICEDPRFSIARLSLLDRGWCSSSPMSAVAAKWAGCGTSTASYCERRTPSPTSSRWRGIWWTRA
ncbi:oligopeptidase B domain protein [Mycobacterium xenopi 3993]|nr:oligopeptidase B domain protein [Mycobacterium xenopi 3993]